MQRYERAYVYLQGLIAGLGEKEAHDALNNAVCKDKNHEDVSLGLLMGILTDPSNAAKYYRDLTLVSRDGLASCLGNLSTLILERYLRFHDTARTQLLWLVRELIRNAVTGIDNICWNLMRYASGGDITPKNINLIESLLDIYMESKSWLDKFPALICSSVYTYLRLIEDHNTPQLLPLRQKEVNFVVLLIRERFSDVITLGRDLVRLLQNVARIPEFNQLWQDILLNPKTLCPTFANIMQLLQTRTSRRFLQSRLTPDMERKLVFLTATVRFGNHKRYQEWFQRQYLATPESQSLRSDMIRFIVGVIHPTNELLCSDIIPRWAVIGWLLTTCTSSVAASNAKLALFYDWLFYEPDTDNIMNIEPAILVMHHSMRSHPAVTATLLDFLCRIIPNFYPQLSDKVRAGIFNSLGQITEKRVLPSLYPLFDSPKLDRELRTTVRETFKEFCVNTDAAGSARSDDLGMPCVTEDPAFSDEEEEPPLVIHTEEDTDDDDLPLSKVRMRERWSGEELAAGLGGDVRDAALQVLAEKDSREEQERAMGILLNAAAATGMNSESVGALAEWLAAALQEAPPPALPPHPPLADVARVASGPLAAMFACFASVSKEEEKKRKLVVEVFKEMHEQNTYHNVGFFLLFYLKVIYVSEINLLTDPEKKKSVPFQSDLYKNYCQIINTKVDICLANDLKMCQECDVNMLLWLIPEVFKEFKDLTMNNIHILHVVVSTVDARQLRDLVCHTLQGNLLMFKQEGIMTVLTASLAWETFEQYCLWQMLTAHDISIDDVLPILPKLEFDVHAEALTSVLLMLKQEKPNAEVVRQLFSREAGAEDGFVTAALMYWCQDYEDKLAELIATLLSTRYPGTSPNKRKRPAKGTIPPNAPPTAIQVSTRKQNKLHYIVGKFLKIIICIYPGMRKESLVPHIPYRLYR